jgi:hypothetical protein
VLLEQGDGLFTVAGLEADESIVPHQVHEHLSQPGLVVDDQAVGF